MIANATGCSSIYGGNLPTTPYCTRSDGRGPSWANSLFEDNAEFGLGMRQTVDKFNQQALELMDRLGSALPGQLVDDIKNADQSTQKGVEDQRARVAELKKVIQGIDSKEAKSLLSLADYLVKKSVWAIGGDGWGYDIGYGGVDHVLASGENINIMIMDTEVYSNTGGQMSKATPRGAVAQFAAGGKRTPKKIIGFIMSTYGTIYVAKIAFGANPAQTVKAMVEAEAYNGSSLVVAYSTCIAQGIDMTRGIQEQKNAVNSGHWPLFRFNPALEDEGKNPLAIDCKEPSISYEEYTMGENRFRQLKAKDPEMAQALLKLADHDAIKAWNFLKQRHAMWTPSQ
jgi:pyruvate-ferredoxin/flavodoxin oxidoreductase